MGNWTTLPRFTWVFDLTQDIVAQASLQHTVWLRMALNSKLPPTPCLADKVCRLCGAQPDAGVSWGFVQTQPALDHSA